MKFFILEKAKQIQVPASAKHKAYQRFDPRSSHTAEVQRDKKAEEVAKSEGKAIVDKVGATMKVFKQSQGMCGPCSVSMALSHFRKSYTTEQIAKIAHASAVTGTDSDELIKAIKEAGVDVIEYKNLSKPHALEVLKNHTKAGEPCIVAWLKTKLLSTEASSIEASEGMKPGVEEVSDIKKINEVYKKKGLPEHYSVVSKVDDKYVYMLDPLEDEEQLLPIKYFMDRWWDSDDKRWFLVLTK
jgi:ABC-type bacteriocin/lantibiotic exporter with double-glycine peptidase domain